MTPVQRPGWAEFADRVAQAAGIPASDIEPESRLLADLGLDSLGLAELIVALIETYAPQSLMGDLDDRTWEELTAGALYEECVDDSKTQPLGPAGQPER